MLWTVITQRMASEPRALSNNRTKSGSVYVNSAILLRKQGSNIGAEIWPETLPLKQKTYQTIKQIPLKTSQNIT